MEACPGCGALFAPVTGATHPYIGASAACWALYGATLVGDPPLEMLTQSTVASDQQKVSPLPETPGGDMLVVDAYAAQHHGDPSPQAIQSVAVHLLVLHGVVRGGQPPTQALWIRRRALRRRGVFEWLQPPRVGTALTLRHLFPHTGRAEVYSAAAYVRSVYDAWAALHGARLEEWYRVHVLKD